jgi:hypothetical protein
MSRITVAKAVKHIGRAGVLLLYPVKNRPNIPSLWNAFFPEEPMNWDWSKEGDARIAELWHLRTELSTSGKVVYGKWLQNRGTLFSIELYTSLLSFMVNRSESELGLSREASALLRTLNEDSPRATKSLKVELGLYGADGRAEFERSLKELWLRLLVVGFGETEEGGYPSLAIGSTRLLFEDLWDESVRIPQDARDAAIKRYIDHHPAFQKNFRRMLACIQRE